MSVSHWLVLNCKLVFRMPNAAINAKCLQHNENQTQSTYLSQCKLWSIESLFHLGFTIVAQTTHNQSLEASVLTVCGMEPDSLLHLVNHHGWDSGTRPLVANWGLQCTCMHTEHGSLYRDSNTGTNPDTEGQTNRRATFRPQTGSKDVIIMDFAQHGPLVLILELRHMYTSCFHG